jgi:hypothetical protein
LNYLSSEDSFLVIAKSLESETGSVHGTARGLAACYSCTADGQQNYIRRGIDRKAEAAKGKVTTETASSLKFLIGNFIVKRINPVETTVS